MKQIILFAIRLYQKTISLDYGWFKFLYPYGYCRFYPTCSEYAYQAVDKKGIVKGVVLAIRRVSRCHPWNAGGIDLVK